MLLLASTCASAAPTTARPAAAHQIILRMALSSSFSVRSSFSIRAYTLSVRTDIPLQISTIHDSSLCDISAQYCDPARCNRSGYAPREYLVAPERFRARSLPHAAPHEAGPPVPDQVVSVESERADGAAEHLFAHQWHRGRAV